MFSENSNDILNRMISNVPSDVSTLEGTLTYNALSPTANEIAQQEINLDQVLLRVFAITAAANGYSSDLENRCAESGITRKGGTEATVPVQVTGADGTYSDVIVQTPGGLQYLADVTVSDGTGIATAKAEDIGSEYNVPAGTITQFPVQISGLTSVTNIAPATGGTDIETNAALLQRYLLQVQTPATSGNVSQYIQWALEVPGIGAVQVMPLWNGPGTIKVCAIDENMQPLSNDLLTNLQAHIESVRPIGATVTYESATAVPINISVNVVKSSAYLQSQIQLEIVNAVTSYLKTVAAKKQTYASYAVIGSLILALDGVLDYSDLLINGSTNNVSITNEQVATMGTVSVNVA